MKICLISLAVVLQYVTGSLAKRNCPKVVDLAMVVDDSSSIGRTDFNKIKKFAGDVISRFNVTPFGAHFAVVKYSTSPHEVFSLTKYTNAAELRTKVGHMKYEGGRTYTGEALELVEKKIFWQGGDRKNVPNVLVLLSDGRSHDERVVERVAQEIKAKDVAIFCVVIDKGKTVDRLVEKLQQISSKKEYTYKSNVDALKTIEDSLVQDMCDAISTCASKPCQNDGECVDETGGEYHCKCKPKWEGKNCELSKWCPSASFSKQGCYKTPLPGARREPTIKLLFNRRKDMNSHIWNEGWDEFIETIVCDCGKAAKDAGYRYFLIEFYGECWGYKKFNVTQAYAGANKCWGKRPNYQICNDDQKNPICVGTNYHGYVYEVN